MAKLELTITKPNIDENENFILHSCQTVLDGEKLKFDLCIKEKKDLKIDTDADYIVDILKTKGNYKTHDVEGSKYFIPSGLDCCVPEFFYCNMWKFFDPIQEYPNERQIFINGEQINTEENYCSYFREVEDNYIKKLKFKAAYLIGEKMERFTESVAKKLLGEDMTIEEINGKKYAYNSNVCNTDEGLTYNIYEIGQQIDRQGRIKIEKLIYPRNKDFNYNEFKGEELGLNGSYWDSKNRYVKESEEHESLYTEYDLFYSENPADIIKQGVLERLDIRFMKHVIEIHGSRKILGTACYDVTKAVGNNSDRYGSFIFNSTFRTKEYKMAFKGQTSETEKEKETEKPYTM